MRRGRTPPLLAPGGVSARVLGPSPARFVIRVAERDQEAAAAVAEDIGYRVDLVGNPEQGRSLEADGEVEIHLTWVRSGYASHSVVHRRDLTAGLQRAGVDVISLIGPRAGQPRLSEWRPVVDDEDDALRLGLWLERRGMSGFLIRAIDLPAAERAAAKELDGAPVAWRMRRATAAPPIPTLTATMLAAIPFGVPLALWGRRASWFSLARAAGSAPVADPGGSLAYLAGLVAVILVMGLFAACTWLAYQTSVPTGPAGVDWVNQEKQRETTLMRWGPAVFASALGLTGGCVITVAFLASPWSGIYLVFAYPFGAAVLYALDPRHRRGIRIPFAAGVSALVAFYTWGSLVDRLVATGLGVPPGVVAMTTMGRVVAVTVIFVVPALCLAVGAALVHQARRESRVLAALIGVAVPAMGVSLLVGGARLTVDQAHAITIRPGQGMWATDATVSRITGLPGGRQTRIVIGEVRDYAVLVPCGGGAARAMPAGGLTFEDVSRAASEVCMP